MTIERVCSRCDCVFVLVNPTSYDLDVELCPTCAREIAEEEGDYRYPLSRAD